MILIKPEEKLPLRWLFVLAGITSKICQGTVYAWSLFRPPLHTEPYHLTHVQSAMPFSLFLGTYAFGMLWGGRLCATLGVQKTGIIGAVVVGLGYLLSSLIILIPAHTLTVTLIAYGLIAGVGCGFAYMAPVAAVGRWFPDKRGIAIGSTVIGFGLSPLITAPIVVYLRDTFGISNTFLILGVVYTAILLFCNSLLRFPPEEWKAPPVPPAVAKRPHFAASFDFTSRQMLRTSTFYLIWLIYMVGAGAGLMVISQTAQIAMDVTGLVGVEVAWMVTLALQVLAFANGGGRPLMGAVCDAIGPRNTLFILLTVQLICLLAIFPYATSLALLYLGVFLFGLMLGGFLGAMPTITAYFYGTENLGPSYGIVFMGYGTGALLLPMVMAAVLGVAPTYPDYVQGFYVTACFTVFGLIMTFLMKPPHVLKKHP